MEKKEKVRRVDDGRDRRANARDYARIVIVCTSRTKAVTPDHQRAALCITAPQINPSTPTLYLPYSLANTAHHSRKFKKFRSTHQPPHYISTPVILQNCTHFAYVRAIAVSLPTMAIASYSPSLTTHLETCPLHGQEKVVLCSGTFKRRIQSCGSKPMRQLEAGMMPVCSRHQDQCQESSWCRAPLACGRECGRICRWRPHHVQLCSDHLQHQHESLRNLLPCHFFRIPLETRCRIYAFLLPDGTIPALFAGCRRLIRGGVPVNTSFLRLNRQIHDEGVRLLYAARTFTIQLAGASLAICSMTTVAVSLVSNSRQSTALADYQMQLMLLEQQNKKRLFLARIEQQQQASTLNNQSSSSSSSQLRSHYYMQPSASQQTLPRPPESSEPAWNCPLRTVYFDMIQSFRIDIIYALPVRQQTRQRRPGSPDADAKDRESRLHDYCDLLHMLVVRFRQRPRPIARLEVVLRLGNPTPTQDEITQLALIFLKPLRRLRNVGTLAHLSICGDADTHGEVDLLGQLNDSSPAVHEFRNYLGHWAADILSTKPPPPSLVFEAYWQLERLLSYVMKSYNSATLKPCMEVLHTARVAREEDDLPKLREAWNTAQAIVCEQLEQQKRLQENVELEIGRMRSILEANTSMSG